MHDVNLVELQKWVEMDRSLSMQLLVEGKVEASETIKRREKFLESLRERLIEGGRPQRKPFNAVEPMEDSYDWISLAFTKVQWEIVHVALRRSLIFLQNVYGESDTAYVCKWTEKVSTEGGQ